MSVFDPTPYNPAPVVPAKNGLALAAFWITLVGAILAIFPLLGIVAIPLAIVGGVMGIIALVKARRIRSGMALSIISIIAAVLTVIIFAFVSVATLSALEEVANSPVVTSNATAEPTPDQEVTEKADTASDTETSEFTLAQENAISMAQGYLDMMPFSKEGLVSQLVYEAHTDRDAKIAVKSLDVDWNEQAAKMAQNYLDEMEFSRQGLIDQLVYEGFTTEQATYGVDQTGL